MKLAGLLAVLVACGSSPPPPPAPVVARAPAPAPPPPAFEPTAFSVWVAGTGRPVILIPGLGCPGSVWDDTVAHLQMQTHVIELAGFAGQPAAAGDAPVIATARDQLVTYIRDRKLDHPVVIGHSLGGFLALWLAAEAPDLVGPVIVIDNGAFFPGADTAARVRDQLLAASDADFAAGARAMFGNMFNDARRAEPLVTQVLKSDRRTFVQAIYELSTTDLRPELPKITAPVLALLADGPFAADITKQLAAIPHHTTKVVPHTHHFVMADDPKATFTAIDEFLR
jgi:N-formylmaleamate deformylase